MATRTSWTVYGRVFHATDDGKQYPNAVTKDFENEGDAWAYVILLRTKSFTEHNYVLVKSVSTSLDKQAKPYGKWKTKHEVLLRVGKGKGWWE